MRKPQMMIVATWLAFSGLLAIGPDVASGAVTIDQSGQGVTPSTIKLGITYLDASSVQSVVNINPGNYTVAYRALIKKINAAGGINGRKIVPVFEPIDPIGTAPAATACTHLTEDEKVFAVIGFFQPGDTACYVTAHDTPIIGETLTDAQSAAAQAPWFNPNISDNDLIPKEMSAFKQEGVFSGKKVAVVGNTADQHEVDLVLPVLKKLKVDVVQTAINSVPDTDSAATATQFGVIAQKFQAAGAQVVIAVGDAGVGWTEALQRNQSTYWPRLIVTDLSDLNAVVANKANYSEAELKGALTAGGTPPPAVEWNDPTMKRCVAIIQAAEPGAVINNPVTATASTPVTWHAPEAACQYVTLFEDIVRAAGKTLNNGTFNRGGKTLVHVTIPGGGGTYDFGSGHRDGDGPAFIYQWSSTANLLEPKATIG